MAVVSSGGAGVGSVIRAQHEAADGVIGQTRQVASLGQRMGVGRR
jgi:hypothetical protein